MPGQLPDTLGAVTSTGSRRAIRLFLALVCGLLAVLGGRQLATPDARSLISPLDGATVSSTSDDGVLAVASRPTLTAQDARLPSSAATLVRTADLQLLVCIAALAIGSGRLALYMLSVRVRRRGPPALRVI